jgi:glycosyltransferase involved in cell wall biosynthesis
MKVGLIGNMNNNNFALLRYFHDIGIDTDLLLMTDDGVGALAHFSPESDTWDIKRWAPHIKRLEASNRFVSAIGNKIPWSLLFWSKYAVLHTIQSELTVHVKPPVTENIRRALQPYDYLIGSGITPALLKQVGRRLDIFYPYSSGVEWVGDAYMAAVLDSTDILKRFAGRAVRLEQEKGILDARHVVTSDIGYTVPVFEKIGVSPLILHIPMLYKESSPISYPTELLSILKRLEKFDVRFISHTRHRWINTGEWDDLTWDTKHSKHNEWIVTAYANFRRKYPSVKSLLVLAEYGSDYVRTKKICCDLEIDKDVLWIPVMPRKYLLEIISACDVGIGEFYSAPRMTWGGVGWEIMACGKPLIHGFNFGEGEYAKMYKTPPPPICAVSNPEQLGDWMIRLGQNQDLRQQLGKESLDWFDQHNGKGLARRWIELITENNFAL